MGSYDYWRNRENEQHKHNITEEKKYNQELNKIYKDMMDECKGPLIISMLNMLVKMV